MKKSILIMDDDIDIRSTLKDILEDHGYCVHTASNGLEGLDLLKAVSPLPGLIILDLMMPNMNGHDFLQIRSASTSLSNVPVAYFSADSDINKRSKNEGVESLRKPVDFNELLLMVEKYCY